MIRISPALAALALLLPAPAPAQTPAPAAAVRKEIRAVRLDGRAPAVDGRLGRRRVGRRGDNFLTLKMTYWIPVR